MRAVMRLRRAIAQAVLVALVAAAAAFIHNALSENGIDPMRDLGEVPVFESGQPLQGGAAVEDAEGDRLVSLEEFRELMEAGNPVLDARTPDEYRSGHIPGAILCDYYEMGRYFDRVLPRLDPAQRLGVYCSGPSCDDSEMLARELYSMGYTRLCVFKGGIEEWTEAGLPLEYGAEKEGRE